MIDAQLRTGRLWVVFDAKITKPRVKGAGYVGFLMA